MISKGTTHNNGARLAAYMETSKDGERAELWQLRGFEATNIKDAFRDVQIMAGATKCEQPFFHVQVRNRDGETLTRQQFELAADRIERMLGLTGQPRAIAFHTYDHNGSQHMHVAWSRIDQDTLTAKPLPYFKNRLKTISRELELHFALDPVTNRREGPIKFAPTRAEEEQARRLGTDIHKIRNTIRSCFDRSDCGVSFQVALEHEGMTLAQGERRDFVVIDRAGGMHALGKRILDKTAAETRERLSDLDREKLPTVEKARVQLSERQPEKFQEKTSQTWDRDQADRVWQDAVINAAIDKEKIDRKFVEPKTRKSGAGDREKEIAGGGKAGSALPRTAEPIQASAKVRFGNTKREVTGAARSIRGSVKAGKAAARTLGKTLDVVSDAFGSLFAPTMTPTQLREGEVATQRRDAESENTVDFSKYTAELAQRRQQQENEQEAERRQDRERKGSGRER